jgi:hypothetical protein
MKRLLYSILLLGILAIVGCEDPVKVELRSGKTQLVVDALLHLDDGPQSVKLTLSQPYFDNSTPRPASGAVVSLINEMGTSRTLVETSPGVYSIDSLSANNGARFVLQIIYQGETYRGVSEVVRGTVIDTLYQEERPREFGNEPGTYLYLKAIDSVGIGDFGWLRYSLNGVPNRRPADLTFPADAAFAPGNADGLEFIFPLRNSINQAKPYLKGDTIAVELLSFDLNSWLFFNELRIQTTETSGLFADPIANVRSTILNVNSNSDKKALGCFAMVRVSRAGIRIQ